MTRGVLTGSLLGVALVAVALLGACLALSIGAGVANDPDDARDAATARMEPTSERALVSTSGRILFLVQTLNTYDAYVANADGSGLVRLTRTPADKLRVPASPVVSPDGTLLVTVADGVSVVSLDRPGQIERLHRPVGHMAWSPDSRRLASLSIDDEKRLRLRIFDADGGAEVSDVSASWPSTAAGFDQYVTELVWSPDGERFAFLLNTVLQKGPRGTYGAPRVDLYVAPADGTGLKSLASETNGPVAVSGLTWSPNGRRLAFETARGIGTVDVDLKWTEILVQAHQSRTPQRPRWSPDGTRLAWVSPAGIVTSDPGGAGQQQLTRGRVGGVQPAWSFDGLRLAFVCHDFRALCVMNSDGSGLTRVLDLQAGGSVFERGGQRISYPVWLP